MAAEEVPGRGWVGFPTLFQGNPYVENESMLSTNVGEWLDMSNQNNGWWPIYEEADRRGEVYDFGEDKEAAIAFGEGSWKDQLPDEGMEIELTDEQVDKYRAGGYVLEELEEGGENDKNPPSSAYIKNVMGLLDKDGVHPLDLVYGNKELGIPKMGTLKGLSGIPELQDYFFDPYGDNMDTYIEQRGDPKEREAATKRKRENYLNNVQRTEAEDQAYEEKIRVEEEIASAKAYEEECKDPMSECYKRNAQRRYQASRDYDDSGQFVRDLGSMIGDQYAEFTYKPVVRTAKKAYNDPLGLVSDLSTTAGDLIASPFTAGKELYDYSLGDGNFEINKVFDTEALGTSLDALSVIPVAKGVSTAFKTAKPILKYGDDLVGASKHAGKFTLPKYKNAYRIEHGNYSKPSTQSDVTGKWFLDGAKPNESMFYLQNLKNESGQVIKTDNLLKGNDQPVRIMKYRRPTHVDDGFGSNMPIDAKVMSQGKGNLTNTQFDEYLGEGASNRLKTNNLTVGDRNALATGPMFYNPSEGIVNANLVNKMRLGKNSILFQYLLHTVFARKDIYNMNQTTKT